MITKIVAGVIGGAAFAGGSGYLFWALFWDDLRAWWKARLAVRNLDREYAELVSTRKPA